MSRRRRAAQDSVRPALPRRDRRSVVVFGLVAAILLATFPLSRLDPSSSKQGGSARPLNGSWAPSIGWRVLIPIGLAVAFMLVLPRLRRMRAPLFLGISTAFGWSFSVSLAMQAGGASAITAPFRHKGDYWSIVPSVDRLGLRTFDARYPHLFAQAIRLPHAAVHPQGAILTLWGLGHVTGGDVFAVCLLVALIGALGVVPTYLAARELLGEPVARTASLLFITSPGVLLYSAAMDAVFVTVTAFAIAALARAWRSDLAAFVAGAVAIVALCFTFGALILVPVALGISIRHIRRTDRRTSLRRIAFVVAGAASAAVAVWLLLDINLLATFASVYRSQERFARATIRPYRYWVWADVAAFLISAGIAQTTAFVFCLGQTWRKRAAGLQTVLLGTIVVIAAVGLFKGETDRIWLLFVPLMCAFGAAVLRERQARSFAAAGLVQALLMEVLVHLNRTA